MNRGKKVFSVLSLCFIIFFVAVQNIHAEDIYISKSGADTNPGTLDQPFKTISKGLSISKPGDTIFVRTGTYDEHITFPAAGTASNRITLKAYNSESVTVTQTGKVMEIGQPYITVEDIVFDGNWGEGDTVKLLSNANYCILRGLEVKNSMRDTVDLDATEGVLIENCVIHDAILYKNGDRDDAHGIVTIGSKNLTIRNTEIYYVSGDTLQFQYGGWDNITIENCNLWNGPLPSARGGAPKGVSPGENAVDTKYYTSDGRGKLFIKNTIVHGWRGDYLANAAAFNLKHNVQVDIDGITAYDNEIAFRLRGGTGDSEKGGARVTLKNAVIYNSERAIRYEDGIENLHIYNSTFGRELTELFENEGHGSGFEVKNCLFLSASKPDEASHDSNMAVDSAAFVSSSSDDYHLATGSPAIDKGVTISEVATDRDGLSRPAGDAYDIGAYESEGGSTPSDSQCDAETHGNITLCTVINTLRICSGLTVDKKYLLDVNNDGKINMEDAIYALQALVDLRN
ncbi:MAG: DUF1565 domain-containing protein [Desulfobacteraceae bacterium]|nr:DUF1565 domain-containing protein [Desulfobacteraceae bacterium]